MCSIDWISRNRKQLQKESECSGAGMSGGYSTLTLPRMAKLSHRVFSGLQLTNEEVQLEEVGVYIGGNSYSVLAHKPAFCNFIEAILWAGQTMCSCLMLHLWLPNKLAQLAWCNKGHINIRHFLSSKPGSLADIISWSVSPQKRNIEF